MEDCNRKDQLKRSQSDPSLGKSNPSKAMSCEGCSQKFTVFKRKKLCNICLRYFCTHCLTPQLGPNGNNSVLARLTDRRHICATCMVLTARPLCRLQLKRLKVKDLQHYLTAQRVSTRGCVEKDDLVNLLIRHVGSTNSGSHQENICNSHTDLSMGSESNTSNPLRDRPPVPPQFNRTNANSTSNSAQNSSLHRPPPPSFAAGVRATVTTSSTTATTSSSSSSSGARVASSRSATTPANSDEEFEIVELTEDWSGEMDETGPEPVVEEISDSAGGTLSSPTSVGGEQNTLSSSTTSLGEPNVSSSSTSSPSHDHSPSHHSDSGPPTVPPTSSPHSQPPPTPRFSPPSSPLHPLSPHPVVTEVSAEEEGEADLPMDTLETASTVMPEPAATSTELHSVRPPIITLNTIKTLEELQSMPVKQIKDLLMRNRVDFRGCCERTELVERVTRLWIENREQKKALERLGSSEMCKICMDAPIECAMLECGHMATCMQLDRICIAVIYWLEKKGMER
ncbi:E3 ubiquitin-protein ligase rififylin [Gryllus bimaculatus]|nr:E3 ubiquitin-protein ligase rififylin [Gryllus bimaculatus]